VTKRVCDDDEDVEPDAMCCFTKRKVSSEVEGLFGDGRLSLTGR